LARALHQNKTLTKLELQFNIIRTTGARALATLLRRNTSLTELNLQANTIAEGALAFASALRQNTSLKHLNIEENKINDEGIKALFTSLDYNHSLQRLDFRRNDVNNSCIASLAAVLKRNETSLKEVNLVFDENNHITDNGLQIFALAITENTTLLKLNIRHVDITYECFNEVLNALKQNTSLHEIHIISFTLTIDENRAESIITAFQHHPSLKVFTINSKDFLRQQSILATINDDDEGKSAAN